MANGKLLVCGIDLRSDLDKRPAARQMLRSLLDYVASPAFVPKQKIEAGKIAELLAEPKQATPK